MPESPQRYSYDGAVVSGATIGVVYKPFTEAEVNDLSGFSASAREVLLPYREDLGTLESVTARLEQLEADGQTAEAQQWTTVQRRDHRALIERENRKNTRLSTLESTEAFSLSNPIVDSGERLCCWDSNGELYNCYQTQVREAVSDRAVMVGTLADGSDCWYLLDEASYGKGLYQEDASVIGRGRLGNANF